MTTFSEALLRRVELFLYEEAAFLDDGALERWHDLFTEDGCYLVPALRDRNASTQEALYIIIDNPQRLKSRVNQLVKGSVWAEQPLSRTRRLIANVRILSSEEGVVVVTSNFTVHRFRHDEQQAYIGRYEHQLIDQGDKFKIRKRVVYLDHETLRQGKLSIIV